tara:strand:- start:1405 stop:2331 length:927 start_codon:yes stop_codon:yes gene_type:complete
MYNTLTFSKKGQNILYNLQNSLNVELYSNEGSVSYFVMLQSNSIENVYFHLQANLKQIITNKEWNNVSVNNEDGLKLKDIFENYISDNEGLIHVKTDDNSALYQNILVNNDILRGWTGNLSDEVLTNDNYEVYNSSINSIDFELVYDNSNNVIGNFMNNNLIPNETSNMILSFINDNSLNSKDYSEEMNISGNNERLNFEFINDKFEDYNKNFAINEIINTDNKIENKEIIKLENNDALNLAFINEIFIDSNNKTNNIENKEEIKEENKEEIKEENKEENKVENKEETNSKNKIKKKQKGIYHINIKK